MAGAAGVPVSRRTTLPVGWQFGLADMTTGLAVYDARAMAPALAVYVTNQPLAGDTDADFGFLLTQDGVGSRTFNVGSRRTTFGLAHTSFVSATDLLLAVNARSHNGLLYDIDALL